jgi:hypothetical protein
VGDQVVVPVGIRIGTAFGSEDEPATLEKHGDEAESDSYDPIGTESQVWTKLEGIALERCREVGRK